MNLAALQREFMDRLTGQYDAPPPTWSARMVAGLEIHRNAYRATLVGALRETFPKTAQWTGEQAFAQAAAHHLILHPPRSWTLDLVGEGFVETLAGLFASDPEVAELAWLEWAMHLAFTASDREPLDAAGFAEATGAFAEEDWAGLRLGFLPSVLLARVRSDPAALWCALANDEPLTTAPLLETPAACLVWREGLTPVFRLIGPDEATGLAAMLDGATFGDLCADLERRLAEQAADAAGAMLGAWLGAGLIAELR